MTNDNRLYGIAAEPIRAGQALVGERCEAVHLTVDRLAEWSFRVCRPERHEYPECTALVSATTGQPVIAVEDR